MSNKIWLSSDLHFCHNREFVWGPRGFTSVEAHNEIIVQNFNDLVKPEDDVYILGDLMLNDNQAGFELLNQLNGKLHLVRGNHDTDTRWNLYRQLPNVVEMDNVIRLKYNGYHFYLSHYPTLTANLEKESLKVIEINLYGHTHQSTNFYMDMPFMYHVGLDSHQNSPVLLDDIIEHCKNKVIECKEML